MSRAATPMDELDELILEDYFESVPSGGLLIRSRFLSSFFGLLAIAFGWFLVDSTAIEALETVEDRRAAWIAFHTLADQAEGLDELEGAALLSAEGRVDESYSQLIQIWRAARPAVGFEPVWIEGTSGVRLTLGSVRPVETWR